MKMKKILAKILFAAFYIVFTPYADEIHVLNFIDNILIYKNLNLIKFQKSKIRNFLKNKFINQRVKQQTLSQAK